jgi:N-acetylglucosaminyldiphosphoundecaprenol N-acetyl-beta-D-mannosaminyltransferase
MPQAVIKESIKVERERVRVVSLLPDVCGDKIPLEKIAGLVDDENGGYICFSTVHMVMESYDDDEFGKKVNGADFIVTDGMPLVWMQKLQGAKNAERVRANDLMIALCDYAEKNNLTVGFYGGKQEVIDRILKRAAIDFSNLKISYAFSPPFRTLTENEDAEILENIKNSRTQILFVGLGCPKQENWMAEHRDKFPTVMLGVGASFDFYAGNIGEAPKWMGQLGLEWLYRLLQEPRRLWRRYIILNPRFIWLATLQLLRLKKFENKPRG